MRRIGILGGSFNPVHAGHLRLAIEVAEALRPDRIDLVPCAVPPHKEGHDLLPFGLRLSLLHAAVRPFAALAVNALEGGRSGPSYTWDTLHAYRAAEPDATPFFILGGEDFEMLPHWHRGVELPRVADFVVVPRAGSGPEAFRAALAAHWPDAAPLAPQTDHAQAAPDTERHLLRGGPYGDTTLTFLPLPRLDISASLLRGKWLRGADIRLLVPDDVDSLLRAQADEVRRCWAHAAPAPHADPAMHGIAPSCSASDCATPDCSAPHCSGSHCSGSHRSGQHGSGKDSPCE
ncbi:nicotinate (nicotinamide) nucleotide adenylyltransferase [Nitratidesulfovibrio sp. SRB-5]|uniref:nicotinate (nicotinamide) nucleotide adenylyltransferase n=1 Tax=Nitratidesulfovibrio sp. SRB-5 TaxID=2872636 RepID=UPI001025A064|nr:nicotinate (nicotinamide) nucleotide adenylyltransferase [Nitratidesulfovibrio sp. SRB-5]MBZ2173064.1 nicotinate (nicotinamide) nucleotide adenylyltransferase [Nitratidesulfovibrio sp. SRB-5]RXF77701.1 nicotinate (nicotinamide) nucleotide adenylyltransferase [Desulfovibrio sp. DS-1]